MVVLWVVCLGEMMDDLMVVKMVGSKAVMTADQMDLLGCLLVVSKAAWKAASMVGLMVDLRAAL
jgi:hypothetical protein